MTLYYKMILWSWLAIGLVTARSVERNLERSSYQGNEIQNSTSTSPNQARTFRDQERLLKDEDPKEQSELDDWCAQQFPACGYDCPTTIMIATTSTGTTTTTTATITTTATTMTPTTTTTTTSITSITAEETATQTATDTTTRIQLNNNSSLTSKLETSSQLPIFLTEGDRNRQLQQRQQLTRSLEEQKQVKQVKKIEKISNRNSDFDEWCKEQFKRCFDFVCNSTTVRSSDTSESFTEFTNTTVQAEGEMATNLTRLQVVSDLSVNVSELSDKSTTSNPLARAVDRPLIPIETKIILSLDTSENFTKLNDSESQTAQAAIKIETNSRRNVEELKKNGTKDRSTDKDRSTATELTQIPKESVDNSKSNKTIVILPIIQFQTTFEKLLNENERNLSNLRSLEEESIQRQSPNGSGIGKTISLPGFVNNSVAKISAVESGNDSENSKISKDSVERIGSEFTQKTGLPGLAKNPIVQSSQVEEKAKNKKTMILKDSVGVNESNELKTINASELMIVLPIVLSRRLNEKKKEEEEEEEEEENLDKRTMIAEDSFEKKSILDKFNPNLGSKQVIFEASVENQYGNMGELNLNLTRQSEDPSENTINHRQVSKETSEDLTEDLAEGNRTILPSNGQAVARELTEESTTILVSNGQVISKDLAKENTTILASDGQVVSKDLAEESTTILAINQQAVRKDLAKESTTILAQQIVSKDSIQKKLYTNEVNQTLNLQQPSTSSRQQLSAQDKLQNPTVLIKTNRQGTSKDPVENQFNSTETSPTSKQEIIFENKLNNLINNHHQMISKDTNEKKFYKNETNQTPPRNYQQASTNDSFENKFNTNSDSFPITKNHQVISEETTENKTIKNETDSNFANKQQAASEDFIENNLPAIKLIRKLLSEDSSERKLASDKVNFSILVTSIDMKQSKTEIGKYEGKIFHRQLKTDPRINWIVLETRKILEPTDQQELKKKPTDQQELKKKPTARRLKQVKFSDVDSKTFKEKKRSKEKNRDRKISQTNNDFLKGDSKAKLKPTSTTDDDGTDVGFDSTVSSSTESTGETDSSDETSDSRSPEEEEPDDQRRVASDSDLPDCDMEGIMLFKKILYEGDAIGFCLKRSSKCVDLPKEWDKQVVSAWVQSHKACYVLWSSPDCDGMEFKINQRKVRAKKTQNFHDNRLAKKHSSIRVCNQYERTHE